MSTTPDRIKVGLDLPTSDRTGLGWPELRDIAMLAEEVGFDSMTNNSPDGVPPLRERVDEACLEVGRDPATLERTVSVLTAEPDADPWWNTLPTGHNYKPLEPLVGEPAEIAEELSAYRCQGVSHVQVSIDRISTGAIERFAPALDLVGKGA